jgi:hypothetical protein
MTELASFECPHCGAKADKPPPGATTRCTFCDGELHSPEAPVREVIREVREVRREVVREVVVTEEEARWARMSPEERARRTKVMWAFAAVMMLATIIAGMIVKQRADDDLKKFDDERARKEQCRKDCEQRCEASTPMPAPSVAAAPAPSVPPLPDPYDDPLSTPEMQQMDQQVAKTMHESDVEVCKAQCNCN